MPQLFPNPVSSTQNLTINTTYPLTGGGSVPLGGNITLAVSSSQNSTRSQYTVSPAPNGAVANFTIDNTSSSLQLTYADVYINGLIQLPSAYTLSGNVLSFNTPPSTGAKIYAVFAQPADARQMYSMTPVADGVTTIFSFATTQPVGSYVDIYVGQKMQIVGTDYYLNINNGVYTVHFTSAPASAVSIQAVFDASANAGRAQYGMTPAPNSSQTTFQIIGTPSSSYIDVFNAGLFKAEAVDYSFQFVTGVWTVTFSVAPTTGTSLVAIFAPTTVLPPPPSTSSVGLALPSSVFTISGSPVTSTGTLTGTFNTQSLHTIFAGPTSGTAVPTFRTISTADLSDVANVPLLNTANIFTANQTAPQLITPKFIASGTTPTIAVGAGAGTGATATVTGHDSAGTVNIVLGTSPGTGSAMATVTFNTPYSTIPSVTITPVAGAGAAQPQAYVGRSPTVFNIQASVTPTSIAGTTISYDYHVVGV